MTVGLADTMHMKIPLSQYKPSPTVADILEPCLDALPEADPAMSSGPHLLRACVEARMSLTRVLLDHSPTDMLAKWAVYAYAARWAPLCRWEQLPNPVEAPAAEHRWKQVRNPSVINMLPVSSTMSGLPLAARGKTSGLSLAKRAAICMKPMCGGGGQWEGHLHQTPPCTF